jgi:hypothetical protein
MFQTLRHPLGCAGMGAAPNSTGREAFSPGKPEQLRVVGV